MRHEFPKTMYHENGGGKVVNSRAEQEALGEGWAEQPNRQAHPECFMSEEIVESVESYEASAALLEQAEAPVIEEQSEEPEVSAEQKAVVMDGEQMIEVCPNCNGSGKEPSDRRKNCAVCKK